MVGEHVFGVCDEHLRPALCAYIKSILHYAFVLTIGVGFGIVLTKSEVIS